MAVLDGICELVCIILPTIWILPDVVNMCLYFLFMNYIVTKDLASSFHNTYAVHYDVLVPFVYESDCGEVLMPCLVINASFFVLLYFVHGYDMLCHLVVFYMLIKYSLWWFTLFPGVLPSTYVVLRKLLLIVYESDGGLTVHLIHVLFLGPYCGIWQGFQIQDNLLF